MKANSRLPDGAMAKGGDVVTSCNFLETVEIASRRPKPPTRSWQNPTVKQIRTHATGFLQAARPRLGDDCFASIPKYVVVHERILHQSPPLRLPKGNCFGWGKDITGHSIFPKYEGAKA